MDVPLLHLSSGPLAIEPLAAAVSRTENADGVTGAVATFTGLVRNHPGGRRVLHLEYEAYEPLARQAFGRIADEARARWPGVRLGLHHRLGRVAVGEASVIVVASAVHRADAFAVCRYAIERVKQIAPIWKRECFEDGSAWVDGTVPAPDDHELQARAERTACA